MDLVINLARRLLRYVLIARDFATVQTPSEFVEVCNAGAREAFGTFSEQTKELSELAQKVATSTVQPLTNGLTSPFRQAQ